MMSNYLIIPGLGNSGPLHWQTFFENSASNFTRIQQQDWEAPSCDDWIKIIDGEVSKYQLDSVVLIGHSMGCTAIAHWAKNYQKKIKGALLVAPSDLEAPAYTFPATGFTPIPFEKFNFKTIVVASENDEWVSPERARFFAASWGSEFISLGEAGHLNVASGYGEWKEGLEILKKLG